MNVDYYKILEINRDASPDDIKRSYRRLSLKYHPDKNSNDPQKTEKFKLITSAYQILSEVDKKAQYDMVNSAANFSTSTINGINRTNFMNMSDINDDDADGINYMNFMNNMANSPFINNMANSPFMNNMTSSPMNEIYNEGHNIAEFMNMLFSQNKGLSTMNEMSNHQRQSKVQIPTMHRPKSIKKTIEISLAQSFTGCVIPLEIHRWIMENNMRIQEIETLYINIPKGIDNNELIVIKQKGNCITEHLKGDVKVIITIKEHDLYKRDGLNLILQKSITFKESICGFSFTINHIDGRAYKINSESCFILANHNQKIIDNLGMERDEHRGNLLIVFTIIYPEKFTSEQIEKLNEIL